MGYIPPVQPLFLEGDENIFGRGEKTGRNVSEVAIAEYGQTREPVVFRC
jgi:hypothetical protein